MHPDPAATPPSPCFRPGHGHEALRRWRVSVPNRTYFITACTHERQPLFALPAAATEVFVCLRALDPAHIGLIASVVMPDHLHGLFRLTGSEPLHAVMKRFRGSSAQKLNSLLERTGAVWQRGYFDRRLRLDDSLEQILRYMWLNPPTPGANFRCERETWQWFRTCIDGPNEYPTWLTTS